LLHEVLEREYFRAINFHLLDKSIYSGVAACKS
jgi:hypothetical protein